MSSSPLRSRYAWQGKLAGRETQSKILCRRELRKGDIEGGRRKRGRCNIWPCAAHILTGRRRPLNLDVVKSWSVLAGLSFSVALGAGYSEQDGGSLRLLSAEEAADIAGGIFADITFPSSNNWSQGYDNLRFSAAITGGAPPFVSVRAVVVETGAVAGAEEVLINGAGNGTFNARVDWPFGDGQKYDLVLQWQDESTGSWYDFWSGWSCPRQTGQGHWVA